MATAKSSLISEKEGPEIKGFAFSYKCGGNDVILKNDSYLTAEAISKMPNDRTAEFEARRTMKPPSELTKRGRAAWRRDNYVAVGKDESQWYQELTAHFANLRSPLKSSWWLVRVEGGCDHGCCSGEATIRVYHCASCNGHHEIPLIP